MMKDRTRTLWRPAGMALAMVLAVVAMWAALSGLATSSVGAGPAAAGSPGRDVVSQVEGGRLDQTPARAHVGPDDLEADFGDAFWDTFWDEFWGVLDDEAFWDEEFAEDDFDEGYWDDEFDDQYADDFWDDEFADEYGDDFWDDEFADEYGDDFWDDEFTEDEYADDFWDDGFGGGSFGEDGEVLAEFDVVDGKLVARGSDISDEDLAAYQAIWDRFVQLIPADQREMVALFELYSDGRDGILAAVAPLEGNPTLWLLSVDPADTADAAELDYTLIHEFAHLLTLNNAQVPGIAAGDFFALDQAQQTCSTYFPGEGCANDDSYIHLFVQRFWTDLLAEFGDLEQLDDEAYWDAVDQITERYGDHFVTEYAMTNPAEDMAETFAVFVLEDRPAGSTVAEQKVLFLYEFPELVTLRDEIRAGL